MSALGRVVRSGVGRRRVQTVVIGLATMMAVTAAVLGGGLLVASHAPFDSAFAGQRGAHLTVLFDADKVTAGQLTASADAADATASAGPFRTVSVDPRGGPDAGPLAGEELPAMTVVGRAAPGGPVDAVTLIEGSWATRPGQIVVSVDSPTLPLGESLTFPDLPGTPKLTVVGVARSISRTADGWVAPTEIATLTAPDAAGGYQMLYRFAAADTTAQVAADRAAVTAAVPAGAVAGTRSWLTTKDEAVRTIALFVPFLTAFGVLGLVMSVLIVGNVVAGAVSASTRRIGILKAVGFTPAQVVRAYLGQALIPAAVGTVAGVVAGNLLAIPVLAETESVYGTTTLTIAPWVNVAVVAGVLGVVAVTALAAAWRAGRLRTVDAIAVGRTPRAGRGRWAARLTARLPLPRPVSLGLARPFARPARAVAMVAAIAFGATAVTFAIGLGTTLREVQTAKNHDGDVTVDAFDPRSGPMRGGPPGQPSADPAVVGAAITAQPETRSYYGIADLPVTAAGATGTVHALAFTGDASGFYRLISGRWFQRPGEAVAPAVFLTATGTRVGDTVTVTTSGTAVTVRIVGEIFDTRNKRREILVPASTLTAAAPDLRPATYHIAVKSGTDPAGYADRLTTALRPTKLTAHASRSDGGSVLLALNALTAMLTLMLVAVAALGVLNAVVLDTRERVHDLGVHKALGMMPRQTIAMVIASVVLGGLLGGAIGMPAGAALHSVVVPAMGHSAGLTLPAAAISVYRPAELVLLGLGGLLIAVLGALLPATWAARTRTATALRTE